MARGGKHTVLTDNIAAACASRPYNNHVINSN
jgi:hypothetical protein